MAADGVFRSDGVFVVPPAIPVKLLERGCRIQTFLHQFSPMCGEKAAASREALQGRAYFPHREVSKLYRLWREVVIRQQAE